MHGAAIFELLLALLDLSFLDFELGVGRLDRADGEHLPLPALKPQPSVPST